jgi:hypothetical protein
MDLLSTGKVPVLRWAAHQTPRLPPSTTMSSSLEPWDGIIHVPEEGILICQECRVLVPSECLASHLNRIHRAVPLRQRREIIASFSQLPVLRSWSATRPRPDGSLPLAYLRPPVKGYTCLLCSNFKTINPDCLRRHRSSKHQRDHEHRRSLVSGG